nr:chloroplast 50S ribosomal protein L20 [Passiflora pittieri]QKY65155.1 chloroplast 50S ribosomal protein L20 [Passiflora pittieri]
MEGKVVAMAHPNLSWKGFRGKANNCTRVTKQRMLKALENSTRDRRLRKREMRSLWISRINSVTHQYNCTFSSFIHGLLKGQIMLNRKVLSQLSVQDPRCFKALVDVSCNEVLEEQEVSAPAP